MRVLVQLPCDFSSRAGLYYLRKHASLMILCSFPSLLFLLVALAHSLASPVNLALRYSANSLDLDNSNTTHDLRRRIDFDKPNLILGYLAVPQATAEEFNAHGFTAIPISRLYRPLGNDGTYVDARPIPDHLLPSSFWKCGVFINTIEMVQTLRGYVDDVKSPAYNKPKYLQYFIEDLEKLWTTLRKRFVSGPPLLAARAGKGWDQLVMLIPSQYLLKSPSNPRQPSGKNHLKLSIKCTPKGTALHVDLPSPEWEHWGFEYWPKDLKS
ncbi:hypothetical protein F5050DRAFT_1722229 [Lentinula boryana]|uniref:Uncharacterized protein n=1 Tax=Lentinula boryana TaxID=40481 RepID=A0ABQ8QSJ1_9AGAR|nr:hypothetical protein F5050DRAFT_1722229 [Lentinula boryana]